MSFLCGGDEHWIKDCYWLLRHLFRKNRTACPRCGHTPFQHGYNYEEYCTHCHLWEPDWEQLEKDIKQASLKE